MSSNNDCIKFHLNIEDPNIVFSDYFKNILTANIIAFIKPSLFSLLVLFAIQLILNIMDTILLTCALLLLMLAIQLLSDLINSVFYAMTALKDLWLSLALLINIATFLTLLNVRS